MKTLFLLRHAKAVPGIKGLADVDRSLTELGESQAQRLGKHFKKHAPDLDLVLSSTALRARQTTEIFLKAAECLTEVRYDQRIYEAGRQQLIELVSGIEEEKNRVLLVGHNPGFEELLQRLTGRFDAMSTCTLAKIDFSVSEWTKAADLKGHLDRLVKPDELADS